METYLYLFLWKETCYEEGILSIMEKNVKCQSISLIENEPYSDGTDEGKFWPKAVLPINHNDSIKERT